MTARATIIAAYAALALAAVAVYLAGRARRFGLVPLGEVIDAVRASLVGRLVVALGWAWLGWHLLAR
jgi:Family of unknown function (DUF6186)